MFVKGYYSLDNKNHNWFLTDLILISHEHPKKLTIVESGVKHHKPN